MAHVEIKKDKGITLQDLRAFVKTAENILPSNTPVRIAQHLDAITSDALHIIADEDSINIYDWV